MSNLQRSYFLKSTESAHEQLTELYCFIWPTIQSYKVFKKEVGEYDKTIGDLTEEELNSLFAEDFEFNQIDFRKSVINPSYDDYLEKFANVLLTNLFAIYEGWLAKTCELIRFTGIKNNGQNINFEKSFQFPSVGNNFGVLDILNYIRSSTCDEMDEAFGNRLRSKDKYSMSSINNQLICYRVFKEIRNAMIHNNGVCDQKLVVAYNNYQTITSANMINSKEIPQVNSQMLGDKVKLSIRGVVGLSDLILRMIITIDAEISCSEYGRSYLVDEWNNRKIKKTMKKNKTERIRQLARFLKKLGFPITDNIPKLHDYFEKESLIIM